MENKSIKSLVIMEKNNFNSMVKSHFNNYLALLRIVSCINHFKCYLFNIYNYGWISYEFYYSTCNWLDRKNTYIFKRIEVLKNER